MKTHRKVRVARMPRIKTTLFLFDMYFFLFWRQLPEVKEAPGVGEFRGTVSIYFPNW